MSEPSSATSAPNAQRARPRIRAVVFDLDGLLFDTEDLFFRVAGEAMAARGKEFTREMMQAMIGRRAAEAYPALARLAGLTEPIEAFIIEVRQRFVALVDTAVHPMPGLFVLLDHLCRARLPAAVATSSRRAYAEGLLKRHGMWDRMAFLLAAEDVCHGKPHPEIYQTAAARFGISPESMLVLEDSSTGLAAAKAAGTFAVGVPHAHSPADGLSAADLIIASLDDPVLLALLPIELSPY
jgi:HAD superfamily hydrolase (TIGR01509 family)